MRSPARCSDRAWAGSGDTNGDGLEDWLVGAPLDDGDGNTTDDSIDRGRAFFHYGSFAPDAIADATFTGSEAGAQFGFVVSSAGDINGGGADDIAVGAPFDDGDGNTTDDTDDRGRVYVFFGGSVLDAFPDVTLTGDENGAQFGTAVAAVFDVNNDNVDDLLVGAPFHNAGGGSGADRGEAYVFFGSNPVDPTADITMSGSTDDGSFGASVSRAGDADGDGERDFIVGAPREEPGGLTEAGSAYLFRGGSGVDDNPDVIFDGFEADAHFGASVAGPGDLDGGGRDLIVGAPLDDADGNATDDGFDRGSVFVFTGGAGLLDNVEEAIIDGTLDGAQFGTAIGN